MKPFIPPEVQGSIVAFELISGVAMTGRAQCCLHNARLLPNLGVSVRSYAEYCEVMEFRLAT